MAAMKGNFRNSMRRSLLSLLVVLAVSAPARPARGCIFEDEADLAAWAARYRADQVALVGPLARKAPIVVVAVVLREVEKYGWVNEFEVRQALKGTVRAGEVVRYGSSLSSGGLDCTPAKDTFYNTAVQPGTKVLLYANGDHLMRATDGREPKGLTLEVETVLVREAIKATSISSPDRP